MWLVWTERNAHFFEDKERTLDLLKALLFGTLFQWAHVWGFTNRISISDFLASIRMFTYKKNKWEEKTCNPKYSKVRLATKWILCSIAFWFWLLDSQNLESLINNSMPPRYKFHFNIWRFLFCVWLGIGFNLNVNFSYSKFLNLYCNELGVC